MKMSLKENQEIRILEVSGEIDFHSSRELRDKFQEILEKKCSKLLVNLKKVSYIDSSGLGELVITYTSARNRHGDVKLLNLSKVSKDLLQTTKLLTVFDVFDDESKAVQSLAG